MKNKRRWSVLLVMMMVLSTFLSTSNTSFAATMEGAGTEESPYLIRSVEDLHNISNNLEAHYKLMNDLDLRNVERAPMGEFKGSLDGDGYTISNINIISDNDYVGLFIKTSNAAIKNLNLLNTRVDVEKEYVGVITGEASNTSFQNIQIESVHITGQRYLGGICGYANASTMFMNCKVSNMQLIGTNYVGGITGWSHASAYQNCYSVDNMIMGTYGVGGLVGYGVSGDTFWRCYSSSTLEGSESRIGGLLGIAYNGIRINECFTKGSLRGGSYMGGLVGQYSNAALIIENSYSTCKINGTGTYTAGLLGYVYSGTIKINKCYFAGEIAGRSAGLSGLSYFEVITDSYFDSTLTGLMTPASQARISEEMYQKSNYNGWDFDQVWLIDEWNDYPRLRFYETPVSDISLSGILLEPSQAELSVGESLQLKPNLTPYNAANKNITWISTNPNAFTIDSSGTIQAIASGFGAVVAITEDGGYMAYCNVMILENAVMPSQNIALQSTAASNSESSSAYRAGRVIDGDYETRWLAKSNVANVYLQLDFGQQETFNRIKLSEFAERINEFVLQIWDGSEWRNIFSGNGVGTDFEITFDEVTSDKVRLFVLSTFTSYGASIYEFEVWN